MSAELDQLRAAVSAQTDIINQALTALHDAKVRANAAEANAADPAVVAALADQVTANNQALAQGLV